MLYLHNFIHLCVYIHTGYKDKALTVAWSHTDLIASGSYDNTIRVYNSSLDLIHSIEGINLGRYSMYLNKNVF